MLQICYGILSYGMPCRGVEILESNREDDWDKKRTETSNLVISPRMRVYEHNGVPIKLLTFNVDFEITEENEKINIFSAWYF